MRYLPPGFARYSRQVASKNSTENHTVKKSSTRISTLVAVGGGLASLPAAALELGEAQVNSSLGQPLSASIAYALAPHEDLVSSCVSLQNGMPQSDIPTVSSARITVANGIISIVGNSVIRDPLVSMRVNVRCPYTANLSREYMLFIDPADLPARVAQSAPAAASAPAAVTTAVATAPRAARPAVQRQPARIAAIAGGTRHRVQPGESLSEIAAAIADRPVGLWAAVAAIFDANPDAFIDNDPNMLKAGSWLLIPDFAVNATASVADAPLFTAAPMEPAPVESAPVDSAAADTISAAPAEPESVVELPVVSSAGVDDNPYAAVNGLDSARMVGIPDTQLESPRVSSTSPNVPTANVRTVGEPSRANWLLWLVGGGVAVIAALLFFGRRLRERFGSTPIAAAALPERRRSVQDTERLEAISAIEVEFEELSATQENLALDADLIIGTGLQQGGDMDVAQDFGFASPTALDLELPEEMSSGGDYSSPTDIIPPMNVDIESILESEVLPDLEESDDYDMSVIVDATKMPMPEDVTQQDLAAVPLDTSDDTLITGDYTLSHEVDYKVLEQDYEDEFTATQALNNEISRAAAELAARMDDEFGDPDNTSEMSMASVTALDITAQLPANNDDDISDLDDTGVNEAITVDMQADDITVEMPAKKGKSA